MSYCKSQGKDKIIFATKEDHAKGSSVTLPELEEPVGLIKPNGEINWSCPCLGGMATGPCGVEFREAFSCFHYSEAEPKGSDCYEKFKIMQDCMNQYPAVYGKHSDDDEEDEETERELRLEELEIKDISDETETKTTKEIKDKKS